MNRNELIREIETALNEDPDSLDESKVLEELQSYDSVGQLSIIATYDDLFEIIISPNDLEKCKTINDLLNLVNEKIS